MLAKLKSLFTPKTASATQPGTAKTALFDTSPTCQIPDLPILYQQYFGPLKDGCFVEVGAFDGEYVSNTCGLADRGWRGFYIEPVPKAHAACAARHARNERITVSPLAIGTEAGTITIYTRGPLSTSSKAMVENFSSLDWAKDGFQKTEQVEAEQVTLEHYLVEHEIEPGFQVLVIDVEGGEWKVLRDFDLSIWRPRMVIIELHDQNPDYFLIRDECNNIVRYFDEHGYKVIAKDLTNTIYVPRECFPLSPSPDGRQDGARLESEDS